MEMHSNICPEEEDHGADLWWHSIELDKFKEIPPQSPTGSTHRKSMVAQKMPEKICERFFFRRFLTRRREMKRLFSHVSLSFYGGFWRSFPFSDLIFLSAKSFNVVLRSQRTTNNHLQIIQQKTTAARGDSPAKRDLRAQLEFYWIKILFCAGCVLLNKRFLMHLTSFILLRSGGGTGTVWLSFSLQRLKPKKRRSYFQKYLERLLHNDRFSSTSFASEENLLLHLDMKDDVNVKRVSQLKWKEFDEECLWFIHWFLEILQRKDWEKEKLSCWS